MRTFIASVLLAMGVMLFGAVDGSAATTTAIAITSGDSLSLFTTEAAAQAHCPRRQSRVVA